MRVMRLRKRRVCLCEWWLRGAGSQRVEVRFVGLSLIRCCCCVVGWVRCWMLLVLIGGQTSQGCGCVDRVRDRCLRWLLLLLGMQQQWWWWLETQVIEETWLLMLMMLVR